MTENSSIERLLIRQHDSWQQGEFLTVEDLVGDQPAILGSPDFFRLVWAEGCLRDDLEPETRWSLIERELIKRFPSQTQRIQRQFQCIRILRQSTRQDQYQDGEASDVPPTSPIAATAVEPQSKFGTQANPITLKYERYEEVGRGGFGVVYRARNLNTDRMVALKIVDDAVLEFLDPQGLRREANKTVRAEHKNVNTILEIGEFQGRTCLVMPYFADGSLDKRENAERFRGNYPAIVKLIEGVASGVGHAHSLFLSHNDLKPSNVLLTPDDEAVITDFGLASALNSDNDSRGDASAEREGLRLDQLSGGTPAYMSPEQRRGDRRGAKSVADDIYGCGGILHFLLTGQAPGAVEPGTPPRSPRSINRATPSDLDAICTKCLAHDASDRYSNAKELLDDLRRYRSHELVKARKLTIFEWAWLAPRKFGARKPRLSIALLAAAISAALATTLVFFYESQAAEAAIAADKQFGDYAFELGLLTREVVSKEKAAEHYGNAIASYDRLIQSDPSNPEHLFRKAEAMNNLAVVFADRGENQQSQALLAETIAALNELPKGSAKYDYLRGDALSNLGNRHLEAGRLDEALARYVQSETVRKSLFADVPEHPIRQFALAKSAIDFANCHQKRTGEIQYAIARHQSAIALLTPLCDQNLDRFELHEKLLSSLSGLGTCLSHIGHAGEAERVYREAADHWKTLADRRPLSDLHKFRAEALINLGSLLVNQKRYRDARGPTEEAARMLNSMLEERNDRSHITKRYAAVALTTLADCELHDGLGTVALRRYDESIAMLRELVEEPQRLTEDVLHLASALENKGVALVRNLDASRTATLDQAFSAFEEAHNLIQSETTVSAAWASERLEIDNNYSRVALDLGRVDESAAIIAEAIKIGEPLIAAQPDLIEARGSLARLYDVGAIVVHPALFASAAAIDEVEERRLALKSAELLTQSHNHIQNVLNFGSKNPDDRVFARETSIRLAVIQSRLRDFSAAVVAWEAAIRHDQEPSIRSGFVRAGRASALAKLGRHAEAIEEISRAEALGAGNDHLAWYNLACAASLAYEAAMADSRLAGADKPNVLDRYFQRAVDSLRACYEKGGLKSDADQQAFADDPDFRALRAAPDFEARIKTIRVPVVNRIENSRR